MENQKQKQDIFQSLKGLIIMLVPMMIISSVSVKVIIISVIVPFMLDLLLKYKKRIYSLIFGESKIYRYIVSSTSENNSSNDLYYFVVKYLIKNVQTKKIRNRISLGINAEWTWLNGIRKYKSFEYILDIGEIDEKKVKLNGYYFNIKKGTMSIFIKTEKDAKYCNVPCVSIEHLDNKVLSNIEKHIQKKYEEYKINLGKKHVDYLQYFEYHAKKEKWQGTRLTIKKNFTNVLLKTKDLLHIKTIINNFDNSEKIYDKFGQPYKLGIFLHGPPGTGKSSCYYAIANEYKKDIYFANANLIGSGLPNDVLKNIKPGSLFVLEDMDLMISKTKRDDNEEEENGVKKKKVKKKEKGFLGSLHEEYTNYILKRLFDVLDGYKNLRGVIVIITTNKNKKFDKALLRSGRIDYKIKLDYCDEEQTMKIYKLYGLEYKREYFVENKPSSDIVLETFKNKYK